MLERRPVVVVLELDPVEPRGIHVPLPVRPVPFHQREEPLEMTVAQLALLVRPREELGRVLAHGLEHAEARLARRSAGARHERGVEQILEGRGDVAASSDGLDSLERRPAAERAERAEHANRVGVEQLDAPVERRA